MLIPRYGARKTEISRSPAIGWIAGVGLSLLLAACSESPAQPPEGAQPTQPEATADATVEPAPPQRLPLEAGTEVEFELTVGQTRSWILETPPDHFVHVQADQQGVDVELRLVGPDGNVRLVADRPGSGVGLEDVYFVSPQAAETRTYRLDVEFIDDVPSEGAAPASPGRVALSVVACHEATPRDRARAEAYGLYFAGEEKLWLGEVAASVEPLSRARDLWREIGDVAFEAEAEERLGRAMGNLRRYEEAVAHHEAAAGLFGKAGDPLWQAVSLHQLGFHRFHLRHLDRAIEAYRRALPFRRQSGDRRGEAITQYALGLAHQMRDETQAALDAYQASFDLLEESRDPVLRAHCMHNLGVLYGDQGDWQRARSHLETAAALWGRLGQRKEQASSLNQLGELLLKRAEPSQDSTATVEAAAAAFDEVLALRRQLDDTRGEASTRANLARTHWLRGNPDEARRQFGLALRLLAGLNRPLSEAKVLLGLGDVALSESSYNEAAELFRRARDLYRSVANTTGEAESWSGLARVERQRGRWADALEASSLGLELLEMVRPRALSPGLRASFFATAQEHYDRHIGLLLDLHDAENGGGYAVAALMTSERARARSLLDLLSQREVRAGRDVDPGPRQVEGESDDGMADDGMAGRVVSYDEIRRAVTAAGVGLVAFRLRQEGSVRWVVTADGLEVERLPPRAEIEELALRAHSLLARSHRRETLPALRHALCELSEVLLGSDLAGRSAREWIVLPDGALHYLPFAVLPAPDSVAPCAGRVAGGETLLERHVVVTAPSASIWVGLANDPAPSRAAPGSLAVVADPVFSANDPRVVAAPSGSEDPWQWRRLLASRREAEVVASLAPGATLTLLDFDAAKKRVVSGELANYRNLHFSTHGVWDVEHPERSGIVLSQVDPQGGAVDGVLRTEDVSELELDADLAVLSACETALGEVVRGEGLVGLSQAFLVAGVDSLVVSLWKVSDGATAALMERFYRALFQDALPPAWALRRAQAEMAADSDYGAPYFWAGFVAVGGGASIDPPVGGQEPRRWPKPYPSSGI